MYYVCVEENQVIGVTNYLPNTPHTVRVIKISDKDYEEISAGKKYFDVVSGKVKKCDSSDLKPREVEKRNLENREFLASTDWKVLRHIREKALGIPTSMSDEEYLALEKQRQMIASKII